MDFLHHKLTKIATKINKKTPYLKCVDKNIPVDLVFDINGLTQGEKALLKVQVGIVSIF